MRRRLADRGVAPEPRRHPARCADARPPPPRPPTPPLPRDRRRSHARPASKPTTTPRRSPSAGADGATHAFSYEGLKRACPCAECRGGHGAEAEPIDPVVFSLPALMRYEVKLLRPAGHYALQIVWKDGHGSGLWRWEVLRGLGETIA